MNITGSPDFGGNVVLSGNPGSGCSSNPLAQFNVSVVKGPTYGSVGMDSPRNNMRGCPTDNVDTSVMRRFRFWKFQESRRFEFRADIFNVLNIVQFNARNSYGYLQQPGGHGAAER